MNERLQRETQALVRSWSHYDPGWLREYLVRGVEDPRLNAQSILSRHFLIGRLMPDRWATLKREEIRFGAVANWLGQVRERPGGREDLALLLPALQRGSDNAEGFEIPSFVTAAYAALPCRDGKVTVPNYLAEPALREGRAGGLDLFMDLWRTALQEAPSSQLLSVFEPACGSANDYRFLAACGLASHLDFTGVDLCPSNIENARRLFPSVRFETGNILALPYPDRAFAVSFVHDLFEHLSMEGLETALDETVRVTRDAVSLGFFRMHEGAEHEVHPVDEYHINALSLERVRAGLRGRGFEARAMHVATYLRVHVGSPGYHNPNAYTLWAERLC